MGEKCRVAFLKLYFSGANLLVLDEPTNYFDIDTKEKIEQALQGFAGALVVVSHDRYLIRKLAARLLFLEQESVPFLYEGGWQEYEEEQRRKLQEPDNPEVADEVRQLELQLARWMGEELATEEENRNRMMEIREVQVRLNQLKHSRL